ncbi:MAG: GyrI-like domain-containing protein, partial [Planctomycetes bacterium]|nr:GyrI-like domain-containing protein [Planctomycetota bacterium]
YDPAVPMEPNGEFEQIAAVDAVEGREIPDGMIERSIDASKYAVFTHKGKLDSIKDTYNYIYSVWVPKGERKLRAGNTFELYDERFKYQQDDSEMDIYIPIE